MAKRRKIAEVVSVSDDSKSTDSKNIVEPKKKSLKESAKEQDEFNKRYAFSADVNDSNYDNSPGEVPEEYSNAVNSWSDYRMVPKMKQEDEVDVSGMSPQQAGNAIRQGANYTSPSASRSDKIYNNGYNIVDILRRKGYDSGTIFDESNRPTLDNPTGEGYRYIDKEMGKNNSEKMEKMPTKPAGKVDTKQGSALVNATKPVEKMEPMDTKKTEKVSLTIADKNASNPVDPNTTLGDQGKALVTAISENPVAQVTQNEILDTGVKDASSPSELNQAVQISTEAKKEAEKLEGNIDDAVAQDVQDNEVMQPMPTLKPEIVIPGDGSTVSNIVATEGPATPSYTQIANTQDVEQGIADMYARMNAGIPNAVVEKLGVQDYYPNIGREIGVGTFSGSRIGSQTIYSGAGALLPMGLYDARKRALAEAAKEKKKQLDKFYDVIETAPQYQKAVNESWNDWLNQGLAKHNFDPDKFLADPNMRKEYAKRLSNAKDITYWTTWADNYLKDADKKENYATAEGVAIAGQIKMAMIDHMDEIASGQKSLKDFVDLDKAKLYGNIIPQMDIVVKETLSNANLGKMPINMRTGIAGMDPEEFAQQRDEFVMKLKSKTLGKDEYLSGFKKFFTGDYEKIVDGLIESGKFSEEQRDAALDYFAGQMQEQIELKPEFVENDQMEAARLAEERRQFNAEFERKKQEGKTPWTIQNELMSKPNPATGKTMSQELLEARRKGLTGTKLQAYMLRKAREMGIPNAEWDSHLGTVVMRSPVSENEGKNYWPVNTTNKEAFIKLVKVTKVNGKTVKTPVSVPLSEFINDKNATSRYLFSDGSKVTDDDLSAWDNAYKGNRLAIKPSSYESYYGVAGSVTGKQRPVNSTTIRDYDPKRGVNIKNSVGTAYAVTPVEGDPTKQTVSTLKGTIFVPTDINDPLQRRSADGAFGDDANQFKYTLQGGESSSSSGSVNYQNR